MSYEMYFFFWITCSVTVSSFSMEGLSRASNLSKMEPAQSLWPAFPPSVKLGLTSLYTTLYLLLFLFVYSQLWLVLLYRHKKFSYQTVFLSLCLLWAALRATLFSFYFKNTLQANRFGPFLFWLLYCFPVCLQFFTLSLMNLYFAQVVFKAKARFQHNTNRRLFLGKMAAPESSRCPVRAGSYLPIYPLPTSVFCFLVAWDTPTLKPRPPKMASRRL